MKPEAVDAVIIDVVERPMEIDFVITPCQQKVPTPWRKYLRKVVENIIREERYTTHEACQYVAIMIDRSYEFVRGEYDTSLEQK